MSQVKTDSITEHTVGAGVTTAVELHASAGINFGSATLQHYEEGTYTPVASSPLNCSAVTVTSGIYTRIGRMVFVQMAGTLTVTAGGATMEMTLTLPLPQNANVDFSQGMCSFNTGEQGYMADSSGGEALHTLLIFLPATGITAGAKVWVASLTYMTTTP